MSDGGSGQQSPSSWYHWDLNISHIEYSPFKSHPKGSDSSGDLMTLCEPDIVVDDATRDALFIRITHNLISSSLSANIPRNKGYISYLGLDIC